MEPQKISRSNMVMRRLAAAFIEIGLLVLLAYFLIQSLPVLSKNPAIAFDEGAYFLFVMLMWLAIFSYILFKDALFNGQSVMKKLLGLRVIGIRSQIKCRWYQSFFRNIILLIPFVFVIELIMVIFNPSGRRLGDLLAGTAVVGADQTYLPKPKPHKRIRELGLKIATWLLAAGLMLVIFYIAYNSIGSGNISNRLKSSSDSVVTIYTYDNNNRFLSFASGFFVNSNGYVVTSHHVVDGAARIVAVFKQKEDLAVDQLVANDLDKDIAILKVRAVDTPYLRLGNSDDIDIGNEIYTIGAPQGLMNTVSKGIISQIRYAKGAKVIQTDAPVSPGNSGGPVLDNKLQVIAVIFAYSKEGQNLNFATPVNYIKALLKKAKVSYK
jgi:uncharacterized RDD family membrane protein YckC